MTYFAVYDQTTGDLEQLVLSLGGVDLNSRGYAEVPDDRSRLIWDPATRDFIDDVAGQKLSKWEGVKTKRNSLLNGSCPTALGEVNCDEASRLNISGAVQMALLAQLASQPFSISWTMADNSVVAHDISEMIAMGTAVGVYVSTCHAVSRVLREAIEAESDLAGIDAIDIESYPWP